MSTDQIPLLGRGPFYHHCSLGSARCVNIETWSRQSQDGAYVTSAEVWVGVQVLEQPPPPIMVSPTVLQAPEEPKASLIQRFQTHFWPKGSGHFQQVPVSFADTPPWAVLVWCQHLVRPVLTPSSGSQGVEAQPILLTLSKPKRGAALAHSPSHVAARKAPGQGDTCMHNLEPS